MSAKRKGEREGPFASPMDAGGAHGGTVLAPPARVEAIASPARAGEAAAASLEVEDPKLSLPSRSTWRGRCQQGCRSCASGAWLPSLFGALGRVVARHPLRTIALSLLFTVACAAGFLFFYGTAAGRASIPT